MTAGILGGKAAISAGTQAIMNLERNKNGISTDINLLKVGADTFLNPIVVATVGNSAEANLNISSSGIYINSVELSIRKNYLLEVGTDLLLMRRNVNFEKRGTGKIGQTMIEIQTEIASQGLQQKYGTRQNLH